MDRSNPYFFISGFISLFLFFFFLTIFSMMLLSNTKVNTFALTKDNHVSISFEKVATQSKKPMKTPTIKKEVLSKTEAVKEVDIDSLFSDVWAKDVKIEKKVISKKSLELIKQKIKKSKNNSVESVEVAMKLMNI